MNEMNLIIREGFLKERNITSGTYDVALSSLSKYFDGERVSLCVKNLQQIDEIENNQTIENLRILGTLSKEDALIAKELNDFEISAEKMTPVEAKAVHAYATNADEDIIRDKVILIAGALASVINGKRYRREYGLDLKRARELDRLVEKGIEYEDGSFDTSYGFDHTIYPKDPEYGCGGVTTDDMTRREFMNIVESLDLDELVAGEYISEEDVFKYGPYTNGDLHLIEGFIRETWVRITNKRNMSRLASLLDEFIHPLDCHLDGDLNRNYIANLVLPARRASAKNMLALLSSFGQQCNEIIFSRKEIPDNIRGEINSLKKSLRLCSYYSAMICGFSREGLKEEFKSTRPISSEYLQKIMTKSDEWSVEKLHNIEIDYGPYFVKIDDHLFEAQASFANIIYAMGRSAGTELVKI